VKGAVAAGGRDRDRPVILSAKDLHGHVDDADVNEPTRAQLEFEKSIAIGAQRHLIVDAGCQIAEMRRRHILPCNRFEVEHVEGILWIGNQIIQFARRPDHWIGQSRRRENALRQSWSSVTGE